LIILEGEKQVWVDFGFDVSIQEGREIENTCQEQERFKIILCIYTSLLEESARHGATR